ncbi:uncharacterized protein LOC144659862 [Oculina patagonica]
MALFGIRGALLTFVILKIVFSISEETCEKIDTCSCKLRNGLVVSLKAVDGGSKPSFTDIPMAGSRYTFDWNPCTPFSVFGCGNVTVCQVVPGGGYPVGSQNTSFSVDSDGNVVISYGSIIGPDDYARGSRITLKCDPNQPGKGIMPNFTESRPSAGASIYGATFTSKYACATEEETCEKIDTCSCKLRNGSVVSLKAVDGGSKPSFTDIPGAAGSGRTFDWNPCTPFSVFGCDNVTVCQVVSGGGYPAGSQNTSFSVDNSGNVVISYGSIIGPPDDYARGSRITLKCDPNQAGKGIIPNFTESRPSATASIYSATFTSKYACATGEETCEKIDTCSCKLRNGSVVSLKAVDGGSKPSFQNIPEKDSEGRTFEWNPCTPFSSGTGCDNVLVCQVLQNEKNPAGSEDTSFSVDSDGNVVITYGGIPSGSPSYTRGSEITLKCDAKVSGKGIVSDFIEDKKSDTSSIYSATYTSSHACPTKGSGSSGGLSVGSILLIIFFPLLLMYFIVGVLINRFGRGIESMPELIPNHSFWTDFPFLVKDGAVFTCGCIKSACSSLKQKCSKDGYAEI